MFLILTAAAASIAQAPASTTPSAVSPDRQAQAVVRIARPAELRFAEIEQSEPERLRDSMIRSRDGQFEPARLVEFQ